jgi:ActR/RegA family two-component response regulator
MKQPDEGEFVTQEQKSIRKVQGERIEKLLDQRQKLRAALTRIARSEDINRRTLQKWAEEGLVDGDD